MEDIFAKPQVLFPNLRFIVDKLLVVLWGKGKGRTINFVQFFVYCRRGFMGNDYSTCVQCFELIIKSLCLLMVFFHIIKSCVFVWNKKTKVGISVLDALVEKERKKPAEPPS